MTVQSARGDESLFDNMSHNPEGEAQSKGLTERKKKKFRLTVRRGMIRVADRFFVPLINPFADRQILRRGLNKPAATAAEASCFLSKADRKEPAENYANGCQANQREGRQISRLFSLTNGANAEEGLPPPDFIT